MSWERQDRRNSGRWSNSLGSASIAIVTRHKRLAVRVLLAEDVVRKITSAEKPRLSVEWGSGEHAGLMRIIEDEKYGFRAFPGSLKSPKARWVFPFPVPDMLPQEHVNTQEIEEVTFPEPGVMQGRLPAALVPVQPPKDDAPAEQSAPPRRIHRKSPDAPRAPKEPLQAPLPPGHPKRMDRPSLPVRLAETPRVVISKPVPDKPVGPIMGN